MQSSGEKVVLNDGEVLRVEKLEVRFYTYAGVVHAVSNVSFYVREGETIALVGETGCGKTITTRAITKLIESPGRIESGIALFRRRNGQIVDLLKLDDEEIRKIRGDEIAYVFQDPSAALDPLYTVGYHFIETVKAHRNNVSKKNIIYLAIKLLREVAIPSPEVRVKNYPHELSGGMRQRSVIAISLSNMPKLLIADEPTTNLDVTIQAQILELLQELQKRYGMSMILITHNLGVVAETANRVYVMYAGKIVEEGNCETIFYNSAHPYTQLLLKAVPNPLKKIEKLESIPGTVPSLINPPPGCRFHPRCPFAMDICRKEEPPKIKLDDNHYVFCWLYTKR
ncbi:MAG: ABC transporter ATP-binding protein [Desulfurococcaceae archaeon]|jgi:peptide/nickel transport system ATP-binding protein|nr:ABC transporter ATP-binding protein [Desulfurococcaceae archaeon]